MLIQQLLGRQPRFRTRPSDWRAGSRESRTHLGVDAGVSSSADVLDQGDGLPGLERARSSTGRVRVGAVEGGFLGSASGAERPPVDGARGKLRRWEKG